MLLNGLKPEEQLLVWSVARIAGTTYVRPAQPDDIAHWERVEQLARWHRLLPLLHHLTNTDTGFSEIPASMRDSMATSHVRSVARNMLLRAHLFNILTAMNEQNIPVIVLKGIPLEESLYDHIGLRPSSDIDLMVEESALAQTEAVLSSLGFSQTRESEVRGDFRQHHHHLAPYAHEQTGVKIDLHWRLVSPGRPYQLNVNGLWERAEEVSVSGTNCLVLAHEDKLIHLLLHFLGDRHSSKIGALLQICDISLMMNRQGSSIRWDEFLDRVIQQDLASAIYMALYAAQQISGVACPADVQERLRPTDFDERKALLFVRKRVVAVGREAPRSLVQALARPGTKSKLEMVSQAFRSQVPWSPVAVNGLDPVSQKTGTFSLSRTLSLGGKLKNAFLRTSELKEQVLIDRWLAQSLNSSDAEKEKTA